MPERARRGSPRTTADLDLLRRMAARDEAALGEFYDRWCSLVYSVALPVVSDPDDADEVVEETFWQAWRQAGRYQGGRGAVSTWLMVMARSRALDCRRSRRRVREDPWETLPDSPSPAGSAPDPLQSAESAERRDIVLDALRTLPAEQREAVELAYFGGMSQSEIAAQTGEPLGTVKTRVRLALRKLKERLALLRGTNH